VKGKAKTNRTAKLIKTRTPTYLFMLDGPTHLAQPLAQLNKVYVAITSRVPQIKQRPQLHCRRRHTFCCCCWWW
jgi:hypothetical protein